jgi:hypothetical protein
LRKGNKGPSAKSEEKTERHIMKTSRDRRFRQPIRKIGSNDPKSRTTKMTANP